MADDRCPDCKRKCFRSVLNKIGSAGRYWCSMCVKYFGEAKGS